MSVDLWVDFNESDAQGHAFTLAKFARIQLSIGQDVLVGDHEGNRCRGIVLEMDDGIVALQLDLGTFTAAQQRAAATA